ncbi:MAG: sigma 54-interacting transcriptional regulator [Bacteroidetes bacterium]|nr:sigma 54-interacting transcriptional regulator [Bacteroidota bacterium]
MKWNNKWSEIALNFSSNPIIWISHDGHVEKINEAFVKVSGFSSEEFIDMSLFDLDENLSKKEWKAIWKKLQGSKSEVVETTFNYKKGKSAPVELNFTIVEDKSVNISCVLIRDISQKRDLDIKFEETNLLLEKIVEERSEGSKITLNALSEKKEALQKLQKLQRHHQSILQSAGDGIYGLDCQGHTTFVNPAAARMVGWELEELIGKSQHDMIHHTKIDGTPFDKKECSIYAAFKDGKIHHVEDEVFWRKDGTSFPIEYISTPIWDENNKLIGAVVSFKDITRRKEAELALKSTNIELKEALTEVKQLKTRLENENKYLQQEIKLTHNFEEIISQSKKFKKVLGQVEQVSKTDATVLILGESGTGKELIARAVHNISNRKNRPMVKVNCAALPATLIESELFGHEKGAFTGAIARKVGRFELADGGSIFLDEIGEIPIELQPKLLHVLQEGKFERLGNPNTMKVDVRVIAATNVNLQDAIAKGTFREDLYYRLNVFPITIPSLRERKEDIPLLTRHFLLKYNTQFGKKIEAITERVIDSLMNYSWPGNVRELENVIERSVIISPGSKLEIGDAIPKTSFDNSEESVTTLADNEKTHILKILKLTNWRISGEKGAAKILNINRTTLEARMKKLSIERP